MFSVRNFKLTYRDLGFVELYLDKDPLNLTILLGSVKPSLNIRPQLVITTLRLLLNFLIEIVNTTDAKGPRNEKTYYYIYATNTIRRNSALLKEGELLPPNYFFLIDNVPTGILACPTMAELKNI